MSSFLFVLLFWRHTLLQSNWAKTIRGNVRDDQYCTKGSCVSTEHLSLWVLRKFYLTCRSQNKTVGGRIDWELDMQTGMAGQQQIINMLIYESVAATYLEPKKSHQNWLKHSLHLCNKQAAAGIMRWGWVLQPQFVCCFPPTAYKILKGYFD